LYAAGAGSVAGGLAGLLLGVLAPFWAPQLLSRAPEGATWVVIELTIVLSCAFGGISALVAGFLPRAE
jgi:ABC-type uncharacterized transport system permease subunit